VFEQIFGQEQTTELLSQEILNGELPQSLLFFGDRYTGRLTTALEIARILTCRESGYVHCQCDACRQSRVLEHGFTILFPNRDLQGELAAAAAAYRKARNTAAKEKVMHAFHLLLRRFDPIFSEKTEQVRKQIDVLASAMEEELQKFFQVDDRFEKQYFSEKSAKAVFLAENETVGCPCRHHS